jgi:hypothetical protein
MSVQTLITAVTGAVNSAPIVVTQGPVTLSITGTQTAAEYFDVQMSTDGGTNYSDLYQDGSQVRMSSVNSAVTIYGPGRYRVAKESTSNACGLIQSTPGKP